MLSFQSQDQGRVRHTRSTQVRHGDDLAELIEAASLKLGVEKSTFLRSVIDQSARRVLAHSSHHVLDGEDAAAFQAALDTPVSPTPRAQKAAKLYAAHVAQAD